MSLEKVNKYKEDKKNRKEILAKEKKQKKLYRIGGWVTGIVIVGGLVAMLGLTAKNSYQEYLESKPNYTASSRVITDMTGILDTLEMEALEVEEIEEDGETAADTESETAAE